MHPIVCHSRAPTTRAATAGLPTRPNDVAPRAYNEDDPTGELPASPLAPRPDTVGFRWTT